VEDTHQRVIALSSCILFSVCVLIVTASPPAGVTPTLIGRGTYQTLKVKSDKTAPFEFEAEAKPEIDIVVRTHDYGVGGSTGWHTHPGPVFITVLEGEVTFYEFDDPTCTPHVVRAGEGYVDTGRGHIGRNESGAPAKDVTVLIAPVGGAFRGELPDPGPHCPL
jgi:hypothetical protein